MSGNNSQKFDDVEDISRIHTEEEQQQDMKPKYNVEEDMMMPQSPSKLLSSSLKRSSLSSSTSSLSQSSPNKRAKTTAAEDTNNVDTTTTSLYPPSSLDSHTTATATAKDTKHSSPNDEDNKNDSSPSALIEIINEYARDHFNNDNTYDTNNIFGGWYDDGLHTDTKISSDYEDVIESVQQLTAAAHDHQHGSGTRTSADYTSLSTIIEQRREIRWEKLLHILYATDYALRPTRQKKKSSIQPDYSSSISSYKRKNSPEKKIEMKQTSATSNNGDVSEERGKKRATPFHPVHAWIRCLTSPYLGLESCRPYGVYSVLRDMYNRIPEEFTVKDETNDNKTVFQTLVESHVSNCKLVSEDEIRDIVEFILEADYRSAFMPRQCDGRLIGHAAVENGWPVKDLLERKTSATCA